MTDLDEHGRPEPPLAGDELATLVGFLDYQRATLAWKCAGLDAAGLRATVGASSMTLGGMLKHLACVEDDWVSVWLCGRDPEPPWDTVDWDADPDWEWRLSRRRRTRGAVHARGRPRWTAVAPSSRSRRPTGGLGQRAQRSWPDGRSPSLRWILVHLIEEYARHNGHADLIREALDGQTGE